MSQDAFAEMVEAFGKSIGLAGAKPDADGYCAMSFDDIIVHFQYDDGDATMFARLGEVDEDRTEGIFGMLLEANLFWQGTRGATLSVDPDTRQVFIAAAKPVKALDSQTFAAWLGDFVQAADTWQKRLASANAGGPLADAGDQPAAPPSGGGDAGHIRV